MSLLRTVGHFFLSLALIVNAGLPSVATGADHAAHQAADPSALAMAAEKKMSCHDEATQDAPAAPSPAQLDCCDGGNCACSCLHHAPVVVLHDARLALPPHGWVAELGHLMSVPAAPSAPAIRPPIV